jgi:hypothetical protein
MSPQGVYATRHPAAERTATLPDKGEISVSMKLADEVEVGWVGWNVPDLKKKRV